MPDHAVTNLLRLAGVASGPGEVSLPQSNPELNALLRRRDGFFAFAGALEVFPSATGPRSYGINDWNGLGLWRGAYGELAPHGVCFAQDLFGTQFVISNGIQTFDPETGEQQEFAGSIDAWAARLLEEPDVHTGQSLLQSWQAKNGSLPSKFRLVPITPFTLGGAFDLDNLLAMESTKSMRMRAELALQLKDVPDGTTVSYKVVD